MIVILVNINNIEYIFRNDSRPSQSFPKLVIKLN